MSTTEDRYRDLEKDAPITVSALAAIFASSLLVHIPTWIFAIANGIAGVLMFLCRGAEIDQRRNTAAACAIAAITLALVSLTDVLHLPLPLLLAQGLGIEAIALLLCITFAKRIGTPRK